MGLVIIGAGGFAREVFEWIDPPITCKVFFYSEDPNSANQIYGHPVLSYLDDKRINGFNFLVAIGNPKTRERLWNLARSYELNLDGILISKDTTIAGSSMLALGSMICPGVRISPDTDIGRSVILNLNSTVGHDTVIGDFTTISPGVLISGNCNIGKRAYIGTGAVIRENIIIGEGATVGMGAVVTKNVPAGETWVGIPARKMNVSRTSN